MSKDIEIAAIAFEANDAQKGKIIIAIMNHYKVNFDKSEPSMEEPNIYHCHLFYAFIRL